MEVSTDPDVLEQLISNRRTTLDHILCLGYGFQRPSINKWTRNNGSSYVAEINPDSRVLGLSHNDEERTVTDNLAIDTHAPEFFKKLREFMFKTKFHLIDHNSKSISTMKRYKKFSLANLGNFIDCGIFKYLLWRRS